ncbi:Syntaxin-6 [Blyttiomyces sp. JEL0837]|nr:Syntaxin-6 [Blyttiomyces sp. JEL0837]
MEDPFFAVKDEVEVAVSNANQLYTNWKRLKASTSRADAEELKWTTEELLNAISNIDADLADLDETVRIVGADPARFKLDVSEVAQRKQFVQRTRKVVNEMRVAVQQQQQQQAMGHRHADSVPAGAGSSSGFGSPSGMKRAQSAGPRDQLEMQQRDQLFGGKKGGPSSGGGGVAKDRFGRTQEDYSASNQKFIERESGLQQQIMRDQDQQLEGVLDTVGNLKEVAVVMNRELDDQTA